MAQLSLSHVRRAFLARCHETCPSTGRMTSPAPRPSQHQQRKATTRARTATLRAGHRLWRLRWGLRTGRAATVDGAAPCLPSAWDHETGNWASTSAPLYQIGLWSARTTLAGQRARVWFRPRSWSPSHQAFRSLRIAASQLTAGRTVQEFRIVRYRSPIDRTCKHSLRVAVSSKTHAPRLARNGLSSLIPARPASPRQAAAGLRASL